jgi:CheY-like chemotaxis protein
MSDTMAANYEELPKDFTKQVKEALEKLYDFQALQENALTRKFDTRKSDPHSKDAYQLRREIIEAIESLNPGQNVAAQSGTVRIYNLIYMHYISRLTIQEAAYEVGVSLRQAYRDLQRGQELISAVLWHRLNETPHTQEAPSVETELVRLEDNTTISTLQELLDAAMRPIRILADKYSLAIDVEAPDSPIMMTTNHTIAQQILTHILSQIIQQARPSHLEIQLLDDADFMHIWYGGMSPLNLHFEPIIQQMMTQLHWELQYESEGGIQGISLKSSRRRALILVIDDNEGLMHLLQRYLTDNTCKVMSAPNTEQGLHSIAQLQPDVIVLDVMMPGMDGWELLQRLRTRSETKHIPVIICSVIKDPELAFAMGASHYMLKPVTRETFVSTLQALQILR